MTALVVPTERNQTEILGVPVDVVSFDQALVILESFLETESPHVIATADASGINIAKNDPEFMAILHQADLVTPDSVGVLWAGKRKGVAFQGRVSGVEMVDRLCALSAEKGYRIYFLGSEPGIAEMAAEKLRLKHPGTNIVGARHGYFPSSDDSLVAAEVAESKPDILFVAMGIPRQEKFIVATKDLIRAKVAMGVGGSLDVFSGRVKRAPKFVQALNLEWLWRTLANPKKISKAKHLPIFLWRTLWSKR